MGMNTQRKNAITLALMGSSITLLLLLQFFWLRSSYRDAEGDFMKETNLLFRNTIFAMHDSLIERSIQQVGANDTSLMLPRRYPSEVLLMDTFRKRVPDSLGDYIKQTERATRIEIVTTNSKHDTLSKILRPIVSKLKRDGEPKTFIFRMDADSLSMDSIRINFNKALHDAGVDARYEVVSLKGAIARRNDKGWRVNITPAKFSTEPVPFTPLIRYRVNFIGVPALLLKKTAPQIFFSIFLTVLTVSSFAVMYRNQREQQRLMEIKNDFISNVTHELKTPVATVSVALEALKNFRALDDPQRTVEYLGIAQSELNRLTLMTDKILKTSVFEDKGLELKREAIDLDQIVQQVLGSMRLVFEKKQVQVKFEKEGEDFSFHGSFTDLTHVLYNLVDNALKYGTQDPQLTIRLESTQKEIVMSVQDNGLGIPKEYQTRIFEKFFRVPSGDVHNTKGYGLGLSYVANVVKNHGGTIEVISESGKGSQFVIHLPKIKIS